MPKRKTSGDIETGDGSDEVVFGGKPVECVCPHCKAKVTTNTKRKAGLISWVGCILGLFVGLGVVSCVLGGLLFNYLKNVVHKCPQCLNTIHVVAPVELLPSIKDELWSFRTGAMAVIVTKRYVYFFIGTFVALGMLYLVSLRISSNHKYQTIGSPTDASLDEYIRDCGQDALRQNALHCMNVFPSKYLNRSVRWQGRVRSINQGFDLFIFSVDHFLSIVDKNEELIVFFQTSQLPLVSELLPGYNVEFNATLGSYGSSHGLYLHDIAIINSL